MKKSPKDLSGCRLLITAGPHAGAEGVCLGKSADGKKWLVSPDDSNEILSLVFEKELALVLDMSGEAERN